jgi:hypothetical protein
LQVSNIRFSGRHRLDFRGDAAGFLPSVMERNAEMAGSASGQHRARSDVALGSVSEFPTNSLVGGQRTSKLRRKSGAVAR